MTVVTKDILDRTRERADKRRAVAEKRYRELVESAARGDKRYDPDKAVQFLNEAGYGIDEFHGAVLALEARIENAALLATLPNLRAELGAVKGNIQAAERTFETAVREAELTRDVAIAPLDAKERELNLKIASAIEAQRLLRASAPADKVTALNELLLKRNGLVQQREKTERDLQELRERGLPNVKAQIRDILARGPKNDRNREHPLHPDEFMANRTLGKRPVA